MTDVSTILQDLFEAKFGQKCTIIDSRYDAIFGVMMYTANAENGTTCELGLDLKVYRANGPTKKLSAEKPLVSLAVGAPHES